MIKPEIRELFNGQNPFKICTIYDIENFEKEFSIKIPEDYRDYLLHFNGMKQINTICPLDDAEKTTIHHMYGLYNDESFRLRVERNMLIFADDSFGNEFAMSIVRGGDYGYIYFIDTELIDTKFNSESVIFISKSFNEFILSLIPESVYWDNLIKENPEIYARIQEFKKNSQI